MTEYYARCPVITAKGTQCTREVSHIGATTCTQHRKGPPMTVTSTAYFSEHRLLVEAGDLLSDHGDDADWDRAIVTLVTRLLGRNDPLAVRTLIIQTFSRHVEDEPVPQYPDFSMFDEDEA